MKIIRILIRIVALIVVFLIAKQAQGQVSKDLKDIIDVAIVEAKKAALNSRCVRWDSVQEEMYRAAPNARSVLDLKPGFEILFAALKDKHGVLYDSATKTRLAAYPYNKRSATVEGEEQKVDKVEFDYRTLGNNICYIRPVGAPANYDAQKYAEMIRHAVDSLNKGDAPCWIIDLRYGVDGDMKPLFAGMGPLLGEGLIATTIDGGKKIRDMYSVYNGKFYVNQRLVADFPSSVKDIQDIKIAVLTSKHTAGAAEILALGFRGRKNTRLFGEGTAGQMTGIRSVKISSSLFMSISETVYDDRKGTRYFGNLTPDTFIEFIPHVDLDSDKGIAEATLWLTTTPVPQAGGKITMN